MSQKPTIGRIVHYHRPHTAGPHAGLVVGFPQPPAQPTHGIPVRLKVWIDHDDLITEEIVDTFLLVLGMIVYDGDPEIVDTFLHEDQHLPADGDYSVWPPRV